ncbi:MAG: hypothetical protein WDN67_05150 [Candidatus Moraniibacteriota bacterium]
MSAANDNRDQHITELREGLLKDYSSDEIAEAFMLLPPEKWQSILEHWYPLWVRRMETLRPRLLKEHETKRAQDIPEHIAGLATDFSILARLEGEGKLSKSG